MAANVPYYQVRVGQMSTSTNSSNGAAQIGASQGGDYISAFATTDEHPMENQPLSLCPERATCQPEADSQHSTFEENHNLVELLEAATTAAGQDSMAVCPDEGASTAQIAQSKRKRKRECSPPTNALAIGGALVQGREISTAKSRRIDTSTDPNLQIDNGETSMCSPNSQASPSPSRDRLPTDARAAGVHSAAALFRRTSSLTARKYTRPPMSKLFMSLNITPENFIALQSLAKAYMLSPAHPERQSCVGNRGKGDTDMVKLRLFNCVRDFLADGGIGEQFFGEHVEKLGEKESSEAAAALGEKGGWGEKLVWPRDGNKIINLVTPLMRRMVTNERQRLYAIDTRKGGRRVEKESSVEVGIHRNLPGALTHNTDVEQHLQTALDPTLQRSRPVQRLSSSIPTTTPAQECSSDTTAPSVPNPLIISSPASILATLTDESAEPYLSHINIFLTYTPESTKQSIKLDEKRISTTRPAHLTFYNYNAFVEQVSSMVKQAELRHPSLKTPKTAGRPMGGENEDENENLRGLAAAANALQPDKNDQKHQPCIPTCNASSRYTIKTIGPAGWQTIDNAETWYHILTERAFATWADGVCNIIIELSTAQPQGLSKGAGEFSEGTSGDVQIEDA